MLLCRWRQVLEDRDFVRSTVRTCIMRKKVSFAFFKQWYWDCFDEDVQVCPVSCFRSQDQAPLASSFLWEPAERCLHSGNLQHSSRALSLLKLSGGHMGRVSAIGAYAGTLEASTCHVIGGITVQLQWR